MSTLKVGDIKHESFTGTTQLKLDSAGRLLLGTTTEGYSTADDLTIATTGSTGITLRSGTSNDGNLFFSDGTSGGDEYRGYIQYGHASNMMLFGTNATERMRLDSSGRLLLGTTTAGHADLDDLTIATSGNTGITIRSGTSNLGVLGFADGTSGNTQYRGVIQYSHSSDFMQFNTADAERMRIDSSGRLLVGSTDATVADASIDDLVVGSTANGKNDGITIVSGTAQNGTLAFADSGSATQGLVGYVHNGDYLRLHAGNNLKVRIDTDGLKFNSDTAAANALNDYEEGSYTPTLTGISGTTSITLYEDKLSYTKIGTRIMISGRLRMNVSNYSGGLRMSLPFAAASGTSCSNCGMSAVGTHGVNFATSSGTGHNMGLFIETFAGQSLADFVITKDNDSWVNATSSNIAQYNYLAFNMHYQTS